jgi:hypothetical protein
MYEREQEGPGGYVDPSDARQIYIRLIPLWWLCHRALSFSYSLSSSLNLAFYLEKRVCVCVRAAAILCIGRKKEKKTISINSNGGEGAAVIGSWLCIKRRRQGSAQGTEQHGVEQEAQEETIFSHSSHVPFFFFSLSIL